MPSVLSLKSIRSSKDLKEEIRILHEQIEEHGKQMAYQKKVESKLREDILAQKKDFEHLEKQFGQFAGIEADYEEVQGQLQMERLEKILNADKKEDRSNAEADKAKAETKKVLSELKEFKKLDPQRLKRQVSDLKKKTQTQASENQNINKALVTTRKELREITDKKEDLDTELKACQKGTDFFWQSQDEHWQLYETAQLLKSDDSKAKDLPNKIKCTNMETGVSVISHELSDDDLAIWSGDLEIPEDVTKEAGKRHKKIAAEDDEDK